MGPKNRASLMGMQSIQKQSPALIRSFAFLMLAVVEILTNFEQRAPCFHFALSLANYTAGSA